MKKKKSIGSRILGIVLDVILVLMVLYIGGTLYLRNVTGDSHASIFGITTHVVISNSMEPNIYKGDILIVKRSDTYTIGDVITYIDNSGRSITHRVIAIDVGGYVAKGDNNTWCDPGTVSQNQIIGKMILRIPGGGTRKSDASNASLLLFYCSMNLRISERLLYRTASSPRMSISTGAWDRPNCCTSVISSSA